MQKVAISACLLGEYCRYDGQSKEDNAVIDRFKEALIIPFCPEAPVLGTPRERISVIKDKDVYSLIGDESGMDVTEAIVAQVDLLAQEHPNLDMIVLKSKSPSCGLGTTPILDGSRNTIAFEDGIAARRLQEKYPDIVIVDEHNINKGE